VNNRTLGTIAIVCAPAMLAEALIPGGNEIPIVVGTASMVFMAGAFAGLVGLWRVGATGTSLWGRGILGLQLLLVSLAFLFGLFEATGLLSEENPVFILTDMAWPLSMLTWNLVSITAAVVGRLAGPRRFALLPMGLALPITIVLGIVTGGGMQGDLIGVIFFGMLAAFWALMGYVVRQSEEAPAPTTAAAHAVV
jgi:hypothetical protein